jgi:hypothetical protein
MQQQHEQPLQQSSRVSFKVHIKEPVPKATEGHGTYGRHTRKSDMHMLHSPKEGLNSEDRKKLQNNTAQPKETQGGRYEGLCGLRLKTQLANA